MMLFAIGDRVRMKGGDAAGTVIGNNPAQYLVRFDGGLGDHWVAMFALESVPQNG